MKELRMKEIIPVQWEGDERLLTYSLYGLSKDGKLYRMDGKCTGWIPQNMKLAVCAKEHKC